MAHRSGIYVQQFLGAQVEHQCDSAKRQAEHIEDSYENRGVSKKEAESRAWATVNKESGGGKKSGSGRGKGEK